MSLKRKAGLVQHLWGREHGLPKKPRTLDPEAANLLAEEKATLPARNQSCEMSGQSRATFLVDFSPDHTKMASTHGDHSVRVTDIKSGKCLHVLKGHPRTPWTLAWHPTSNDILASGCLAGVVRIWDLRGGGCEVWKTTDGAVISSLTFHPTDQVLVIAADNYIHFWDWTQERPFTKCKTARKEEKVRWVKFDRWGQYLYTGIVNSVTNNEEQNEEVGYINNTNRATASDAMCNEERQNLQSYYRDIVEQITNHQRDRINQNDQQGRNRMLRHSDTLQQINSVYPAVASVSQRSGETYSGPHQANISMVGPHSPVHLDILEDARQYASHLTQRVHQARQYAAHLTHSTWLGHDDAERQVIRIRNHQAGNDERNARVESDGLGSLDGLVSNDTATTLNDRNLLHRLPSATEVLNALPNNSRSSSFGRVGFSSSSVRNVTSPLMVSVPSPSLPYPTASITTSALMVSMPSISHASTMQGTSPTVTLTGVSLSNTITSVASGSTTVSTTACSVIPSTGSIHPLNAANLPPGLSQANLGLNSSLSTTTSPSPSYTRLISHSQAARMRTSSRSNSLQGAASSPQRHSKSNKRPRDSSNSPVRSQSAEQSSSSQSSRSSVVNSPNCTSSQPNSERAYRLISGVPASSASTVSAAQCSGPSLLGSLLRTQLRSSTSASDCPSSHSSLGNASVSRSNVTSVTVIPESSSLPASAAAASSSHRPSLLRCHLLAQQSNNNVTRDQVASLSGSSQAQATEQEGENGENRQMETDMNHNNIGQLGPRGVEAVGSSGPLGTTDSASSSHLASVVGNEVRNVLERVRSRQIDIQHTLSAFCQLQGPAEASVSQELPTSLATSSAPIVQSYPESSSSNEPSSSTATSHTATLPSSVSSISEEVDRRLESLNQLGQRVSQITQRMSERARNLVQEGNRTLGEMRRHHRRSSHRQQPYPTSQQRQRRLQAILEMWRPCQRMAAAGAAEARPRDANSSPRAEETRGHAEADQEGVTHLHRRHRQLRVEIENMHSELTRRIHQQRRDPSWFTLQRRTLHPHYSVSILDDTINRNDGLQAAINRAIAGAFMGVGESAVASNIISETYRIQRWDFNNCQIPDISQAFANIVVSPCKIHNDASCDISQDGRYLCTFVPSHRGFPDDTILGVFSLESSSLGQCFYTKSFGPNAISVSISPLNNYVLVGLAAKRLAWVFTQKQMVAQIFKLRTKFAGEDSVEHICDLMHPCELDIRSHITVNSARWLPGVGEGVVYGTNRGDLHICTPGDDERDSKEQRPPVDAPQDNNFDQRNLMQMLGLAVPQTMSAGTQTVHRIRRSASTQTESSHHIRDVD